MEQGKQSAKGIEQQLGYEDTTALLERAAALRDMFVSEYEPKGTDGKAWMDAATKDMFNELQNSLSWAPEKPQMTFR